MTSTILPTPYTARFQPVGYSTITRERPNLFAQHSSATLRDEPVRLKRFPAEFKDERAWFEFRVSGLDYAVKRLNVNVQNTIGEALFSTVCLFSLSFRVSLPGPE